MKRLKEWMSRRKSFKTNCGTSRSSLNVDPLYLEGQKERWQQELQEFEQKRNDLPSAGQKRSSVRRTLATCDEEMERVYNEIVEKEARFQESAHKSQRIRWAGDGLDEEIRILQAGERQGLRSMTR